MVDGESRALEQRPVILPGRVADPHLGVRRKAAQEVGADLEGTGTAQRLHGDGAPGLHDFALGPEEQRLGGLVVGGETVDRQIAAGGGAGGDLAFSPLHALEQRDLAGVVGVHTHAEVHLVRIGVGDEGFGDPEDGVPRREFDGGEYGGLGRCDHGSGRRESEGSLGSLQTLHYTLRNPPGPCLLQRVGHGVATGRDRPAARCRIDPESPRLADCRRCPEARARHGAEDARADRPLPAALPSAASHWPRWRSSSPRWRPSPSGRVSRA